jgi:alpha-glucuronidase
VQWLAFQTSAAIETGPVICLIASDWIKMTFSNKKEVVEKLKKIMLESHQILVNYMTPLGLHHIMGANHHYGPGPWVDKMSRPDWTSTYYHKADSIGIGFDRTATGSNALQQYPDSVRQKWGNMQTCPDKYLLWFHHVKWDSVWDRLCTTYNDGLTKVNSVRSNWLVLKPEIDAERFTRVNMLLERQIHEAKLWHHSCLLYFQTFSKRPIPRGIDVGNKPLEYYMKLEYPYAPGIRPKW